MGGSLPPAQSYILQLWLWMTHQSIKPLWPNPSSPLHLVLHSHPVSINHKFRDNDAHSGQVYFHWPPICINQWYTFKGQSQTMIRLHAVVIAKRFHYIASSYTSSSFQVTMCVKPDPCTPLYTKRGRYTASGCLMRAECVRWVINSIRNKDLLHWDALCCNGCLIGSRWLYWQVKWTD